MTISSWSKNQHGQNTLQLHVSISCPERRQAIVTLLEQTAQTDEGTILRQKPGLQPHNGWPASVFWDMHWSMPDAVPHERPPTRLESALRYDRAPLLVLAVLLPLVAWAWIVVMARDMYGPMTGASAWMMTPTWDLPHLLLL